MAPIVTQRYEKKYGVDESVGIPRCLMAAKFISQNDPTGELTLSHWVAQGQIQDLPQVFIVFWTLSVFRGCNVHTLLDLQQDIAKCFDLLHFSDFEKQTQQNTQNINISHSKHKFNTLNIYSILYAIKPSLENFRSSTQTDSRCAALGSLWPAPRTPTPLLPRLPRPVDTAIK